MKNKNNSEIIRKEFFRKLYNSGFRIECIGYYLPNLIFDNPKLNIVPIYFDKTTFVDKLNLSNMEFNHHISFANVRFKKGADFLAAKFHKTVNFSNATNNEQINFRFCKFEKPANFKDCKFKNTNFSNVYFDEIDFTSANFGGKETSFWKTNFKQNAIFIRSQFNSITNFKDSLFAYQANFEDAKFNKKTKFENTSFSNNNQTNFNGNISQISFLETKINKIKFGNKISWKESNIEKSRSNKLKLKIYESIGHKNFQYKILDERELEKKKESPILLESVKDIYRQLIENFDQQMRYDISGEFFIREMELRRKYKTIQHENKAFTIKKHNFKKHFSILWLYNIIAQYGESIKRPIYIIFPIILSSTIYFWCGNNFIFDDTKIELSWNSFVNSLLRSLNGFFPFYDFNKEIQKSEIDFILRITLLPIMGSLFVALKRRLERKFRH